MGKLYSKNNSEQDFPYAAVGAFKTSSHGGLHMQTFDLAHLPQRNSPDGCTISNISSGLSAASSETSLKRVKNPTFDVLDNVAYMVEAFQPLIESSVKVTELLPYLTFINDKDTFITADRNCPADAVRLLIERIEHDKERSHWQAFLEALEHAEYEYIVHLLKGETEEDHTVYKTLLKLFAPIMIQQIYPREFIDKLYAKSVISTRDKEEIECELTNRGETAASFLLLDRIPRKLTKWYQVFIDMLIDCEMTDIAKAFQETVTSTSMHRSSRALHRNVFKRKGKNKHLENDGYITAREDISPRTTTGYENVSNNTDKLLRPDIPPRPTTGYESASNNTDIPLRPDIPPRPKNINKINNMRQTSLSSQTEIDEPPPKCVPNVYEVEIKQRTQTVEQLQIEYEYKKHIKELKRMERSLRKQLDDLDSDSECTSNGSSKHETATKTAVVPETTNSIDSETNALSNDTDFTNNNTTNATDLGQEYDFHQNLLYSTSNDRNHTGILVQDRFDLLDLNTRLQTDYSHILNTPVTIFSSGQPYRPYGISSPIPHLSTAPYIVSADSAMFSFPENQFCGSLSSYKSLSFN